VVIVPFLVFLDYEDFVLFVFHWFMTGKHLVRCWRRNSAPLVPLVAALAVPQHFKHVVRSDLCLIRCPLIDTHLSA